MRQRLTPAELHAVAQGRGRTAKRHGDLYENWFEQLHRRYRAERVAFVEKQRQGLRVIEGGMPMKCVPMAPAPPDYLGDVAIRTPNMPDGSEGWVGHIPVMFDVKSSESGKLDVSLKDKSRGLTAHQYQAMRDATAFGYTCFVLFVHDTGTDHRCYFIPFSVIQAAVDDKRTSLQIAPKKDVPSLYRALARTPSLAWDWASGVLHR